MKSFNEFVSKITNEEYETIRDDILQNREPGSLTNAIPEISFKIALKLLEKYHSWLND